ncbi:hypothetical protein [Hoyosella altamirensis]|uniref:Uncharacterized protein n=1 Tax=Hoyosella altamirensis TaxID=616997 RepID=A0A839RRY7_9ACTN|nr:hypothetical protein [Hoyosella altamirensis]MBB3038978.1 hypothetical protein [Hoyosella altamirensis]
MTDEHRRAAADYLAALDPDEREQFLRESLDSDYRRNLEAVRSLFPQEHQTEPDALSTTEGNHAPREGNNPPPPTDTGETAFIRQLFNDEPTTWS